MKNERRDFIKKTVIAGAGISALSNNIFSNTQPINPEKMKNRPKVLFFDVNETLLDLTKMEKSVGKVLNGRKDLLPLWFSKMLHYSLVTTVAGQYEDFAIIGSAALQMVAANNNIQLSRKEAEKAIVEPLRSLPTHPEVKEALERLKDNGYTMVSFTNSSHKGVQTQFENAGLIDYFDDRLSIETIGKYKPHEDTYKWAARKMNVKPEECFMIAAHGWDIAGAVWAGWRSAFINRPGKQLYPLTDRPEINEPSLKEVADYLISLK